MRWALQSPDDDAETKRICASCVKEPFLSGEISRRGSPAVCSCCDEEDRTLSMEEIADLIERAFEDHYVRTSDQPDDFEFSIMRDRESPYDWERQGDPVVEAIAYAADIPDDAAQDIQAILEERCADMESAQMGEETEFAGDSYYERKRASDETWQSEWAAFEQALKTEARFFSQAAAEHLTAVFRGIDTLTTKEMRPIVVDAGPGTSITSLYRARVFQSPDEMMTALERPDLHLAAPPAALAAAGRMNARGISTFYGADDPGVALAEVRPPVGSDVVVGRFDIIRPLRLLDLTALSSIVAEGSIFDPTFVRRIEHAMFLRTLGHRITRPVMPNDEALDYLPTQAVADFLATGPVPLEGIIFRSVQQPGSARNVVLFHKAARTMIIDLRPGTDVRAHAGFESEDGFETSFSVVERVPEDRPANEPADFVWPTPRISLLNHGEERQRNRREFTLRVDLDSLQVHHVKAVSFSTDVHAVDRRRWTKSEAEDF